MQRLANSRLVNRKIAKPTVSIPPPKKEKIPISSKITTENYYTTNEFFTFHNNYVNNKECIILIPIYKIFNRLTILEKNAIMQCINILSDDYEICLLLPYNLGIKEYIKYFNYQFSTLRCNPRYFKSREKYNTLCLDSKLYDSFNDYKYMLLYQLDAWVFKNELHEWCEKGYEYIGAPMHDKEGGFNGGFSLRLIKSFINKTNKPLYFIWEDRYYSKIMTHPTHDEAMLFSVQDKNNNGRDYVKNGKTFGCHYTNINFSDLVESEKAIKPIKKRKRLSHYYDYELASNPEYEDGYYEDKDYEN